MYHDRHDSSPLDTSRFQDYPLLVIPKKCIALLKREWGPKDDVIIEVKIVASDSCGNDYYLYRGSCNFHLVDGYSMSLYSMNREEGPRIGDLPVIMAEQQQSEHISKLNPIWNASLIPYLNDNDYNPAESQQYSVDHTTSDTSVTVERQTIGTYVARKVYNANNSVVQYASFKTFIRYNQHHTQPANIPITNQYEHYQDEIESGGVRGIKTGNTDNIDDSGIADVGANEALRQLMSSDIGPVCKQRRTILYLGTDVTRGQTIQQIQYNDPNMECSSVPTEVYNEVVVDTTETIPPNLKKYQCVKCGQIFSLLSKFREHMDIHAVTHAKANGRSRSTSPTTRYVCFECGKKLTGKKKFEQHCLAHGNPDLECAKCGNVFATKFTLRIHSKIHNRKYCCNFCIRSYDDLEPYKAHVTKFHSRFECEYCNYVAYTKSDLASHQNIHKAVYTFDGDRDSNEADHHESNDECEITQSMERDWVCDKFTNTQENCDYNQENHNIPEAGYGLNDENINETRPLYDEDLSVERNNVTYAESRQISAQDKQNEMKYFFEYQSKNNDDIIICEDQQIIREDYSADNSYQTQFYRGRLDITENKIHQSQYASKENELTENQFDNTENEFSGNQFESKENNIDESQFDSHGNELHETQSDRNGNEFIESQNVSNAYEVSARQFYSTEDTSADQNKFDSNGDESEFNNNGSQIEDNGSEFDEIGPHYSNESSSDMQDDPDDEDYKICIDENSNDSNDSTSCENNDSIITKAISNKAFYASRTAKSRNLSKLCDVCHKKFNRISDLKRHLIEHVVSSSLHKMPASRSGILDIKCQVCHKATFHKIDQYKAHLREHAQLTLYRCTFCNKSFSDSSNFSKHKKIHGATYFQCDLCQRKFNSKQMISRHMEYHLDNAPLPCPICEKKFHFNSTLNKHIKSVHSKRATSRFKCRFCSKHFGTLKGKWDHEWNAHNIRKMIVDCLLCGAKYRKYSELKKHCKKEHKVRIPPAKNLITNQTAVSEDKL